MTKKGLTNALVIDTCDSSINYRKYTSDNAYHYEISINELFDTYNNNPENLFNQQYDTRNSVSLILNDNIEISLSEYQPGMTVSFIKVTNDIMTQTSNQILIYPDNDFKRSIAQTNDIYCGDGTLLWQSKERYMLPTKFRCDTPDSTPDYHGFRNSEMTMDKYIAKPTLGRIPAIEYCNMQTIRIGNKEYQGYLPAINQLMTLFKYKDMVDYILRYIGKPAMHLEDFIFWSSSECVDCTAWSLFRGEPYARPKDEENYRAFPFFKMI